MPQILHLEIAARCMHNSFGFCHLNMVRRRTVFAALLASCRPTCNFVIKPNTSLGGTNRTNTCWHQPVTSEFSGDSLPRCPQISHVSKLLSRLFLISTRVVMAAFQNAVTVVTVQKLLSPHRRIIRITIVGGWSQTNLNVLFEYRH